MRLINRVLDLKVANVIITNCKMYNIAKTVPITNHKND